MATTYYTGHLPEQGALSPSSADIELLLGDTVFLAHRDFLEGQSWILQVSATASAVLEVLCLCQARI
mgnify:FL=1